MIKFAILDNIRVLPETQSKIKELAAHGLIFPDSTPASFDELVTRTGNAEAVLVSPATELSKAYFDACPSVKYVGLCGTSAARIDLETVKERAIVFSSVSDYGDEPTAECIFLHLESLVRGVGKYQWQEQPRELMGKSLGIIGLGALGKAIADLALAYKTNAYYFSAHRKQDYEDKGLQYAELHELLRVCQIVIISTPTNLQVLDTDEFDLMQPNSILVQASSGTTFNRDAFLRWVAKDDNYAIFDRGVGEDSLKTYKELPRIVLFNGGFGGTYETSQRLGNKVVENLKGYIA
jgi:phosphoglycerate dehydrogenase-like enzyme